MRVASTTPRSKKGNGRDAKHVRAGPLLPPVGVEELCAGLTKEKIGKDMLRKCSEADRDWSGADAANGVDAPDNSFPRFRFA